MIYNRYLVVPGPKLSHMVHCLGGSLIVQVGPWSFRVLDGLWWSKMVRDGLIWSNLIQNGPRGSKMVPDGPRWSKLINMVQDGQIWFKKEAQVQRLTLRHVWDNRCTCLHVWGESEFIWMDCKLCLCFNVFAGWESISAWPSGRMWQLAEKRHYAPTVEASDCTLYTIRLVGSQCTKTQSRETALCGDSGREWMYTVQTVQTPCSGNQCYKCT